jgi:hypothetical protein
MLINTYTGIICNNSRLWLLPLCWFDDRQFVNQVNSVANFFCFSRFFSINFWVVFVGRQQSAQIIIDHYRTRLKISLSSHTHFNLHQTIENNYPLLSSAYIIHARREDKAVWFLFIIIRFWRFFMKCMFQHFGHQEFKRARQQLKKKRFHFDKGWRCIINK